MITLPVSNAMTITMPRFKPLVFVIKKGVLNAVVVVVPSTGRWQKVYRGKSGGNAGSCGSNKNII